jgi:hypothetical protein
MKAFRLLLTLMLGLLCTPFVFVQNWQLVWQDESHGMIGHE